MLAYYGLSTTETMHEKFFPWYLNANARASESVLKTFGYKNVARSGNTLSSSTSSITVERGCDAAAPSALFVAAVLASPVGIMSRLVAVIAGLAILAFVNLIRIISLFLTAAHWKPAFDIMHLDVWQAAFIILSIVLWAVWASWAVKRQHVGRAPAGG
ncbi:MAG: archaeosortase/exosortase family protein [Planctomycetes bacterium]|nr:archaeosortase/exosortase family protein [Planctomycetota bacterium]